MKPIVITVGDLMLQAELNSSPTAEKIWDALPVEATANVWGDEIYFEIPVAVGRELDAREEVEVGELGYWPSGKAFCVFYGPTPVSIDEKPRAYSPVNVFGKIIGDTGQLKAVSNGTTIKVKKI